MVENLLRIECEKAISRLKQFPKLKSQWLEMNVLQHPQYSQDIVTSFWKIGCELFREGYSLVNVSDSSKSNRVIFAVEKLGPANVGYSGELFDDLKETCYSLKIT